MLEEDERRLERTERLMGRRMFGVKLAERVYFSKIESRGKIQNEIRVDQ